MRIGLISDTHVPESGRELWPQVYEAFLGIKPVAPKVDMVLHAGDMHVLDVLDWLEERLQVPVVACRGNGDDGSGGRAVVPEDPRLKPDQVVEVEGVRIGLTHSILFPDYIPLASLEEQMDRYFGGPVDVIVHGHTHVAEIRVHNEVLCINAGSPVYPRNLERRLGTIGFLDIVAGRVEPSLYQLV
jgi:uncharacterized protein